MSPCRRPLLAELPGLAPVNPACMQNLGCVPCCRWQHSHPGWQHPGGLLPQPSALLLGEAPTAGWELACPMVLTHAILRQDTLFLTPAQSLLSHSYATIPHPPSTATHACLAPQAPFQPQALSCPVPPSAPPQPPFSLLPILSTVPPQPQAFLPTPGPTPLLARAPWHGSRSAREWCTR